MTLRKELIKRFGSVPAYNRFEIIQAIQKVRTEKIKALISFLYLTGARISEITKYYNKKTKNTETPLLTTQVEIVNYQEIRITGVRCLKRKKKIKRDIPILKTRFDTFFYKTFINFFHNNEEEILFNFSRQYAHQQLQEVGLFPHLLRHSRVTHLVRDYCFDVPHLQKIIGWSRSDTAANYTHLNIHDLAEKQRKYCIS